MCFLYLYLPLGIFSSNSITLNTIDTLTTTNVHLQAQTFLRTPDCLLLTLYFHILCYKLVLPLHHTLNEITSNYLYANTVLIHLLHGCIYKSFSKSHLIPFLATGLLAGSRSGHLVHASEYLHVILCLCGNLWISYSSILKTLQNKWIIIVIILYFVFELLSLDLGIYWFFAVKNENNNNHNS